MLPELVHWPVACTLLLCVGQFIAWFHCSVVRLWHQEELMKVVGGGCGKDGCTDMDSPKDVHLFIQTCVIGTN